ICPPRMDLPGGRFLFGEGGLRLRGVGFASASENTRRANWPDHRCQRCRASSQRLDNFENSLLRAECALGAVGQAKSSHRTEVALLGGFSFVRLPIPGCPRPRPSPLELELFSRRFPPVA